MTGLLIAALAASTHANRPWQRSPAALAMRCSGSGSGANGAARWSTQRLWFGCKPLGYCQGRLEMRLNQPQHRMLPLRAPILTKMVVSASMASVLMRCCSSHNRSTGGLLIRTTCMRRVHHMRGGADDVTGLLIAALTASTHANRLRQRSEVLLSLPCDSSQSCCW